MKCSNCNAEIMEGALFCSECGTKFTPPETIDTPAAEAVEAATETVDTPVADIPAEDPLEAPAADIPAFVPAEPVSDVVTEAVSEIPSDISSEIPSDIPSEFPQSDVQPFAPAEPAPVFQPEQPAAFVPPLAPAEPAPAFQPMPQPAQPTPYTPASAPSENKDNGGKQKKFLVPMVIFIVLFALAAAAIGVGTYLFMKEKKDNKDLKAQIEDLDNTIDEKDDVISEMEGNLSSLEENNSRLENEKSQLTADLNDVKTDLSTAQQERDDYKNQIDVKDPAKTEIYTAIDGLEAPSNMYGSTKNVVILHPGETETMNVIFNATGSQTVSWKSDNKIANGKWEGDWAYEGKIGICTFTFSAGSQTGRTVFTFTNSANEETFQVVVYVI